MPAVGRAVIVAAVLAVLVSVSASAQQHEVRATTPLVPRAAGVQRASERPDGRELALAGAALARMREVFTQIFEQAQEARAERDIIELNCLNEKLTAVKGLLAVSERARVTLERAVGRGDGEASAQELDKMTIAQRTCDELLAESEGCIGELATYSGETAVEMVEGVRGPDPTSRTGEQPFLDRPPSASPYQ